MSATLTPRALVTVRAAAARREKKDRDVKLHLTDSLYDALARLAQDDRRAVGEYIRVVLERHVYGALGAGS